MTYAVIQTGGKQYKVSEGDMIEIELLKDVAPKGEVVFHEVLLTVTDGKVQVGTPFLTEVGVKGVLQEEIVRGPKIRVMKYKAKVRHRRATGHRQKLSQVLIQSIGAATKTVSSAAKKPAAAKKAPAKKAA
jgi:large subunit ribosomal protein L21